MKQDMERTNKVREYVREHYLSTDPKELVSYLVEKYGYTKGGARNLIYRCTRDLAIKRPKKPKKVKKQVPRYYTDLRKTLDELEAREQKEYERRQKRILQSRPKIRISL